MKLRRVEIENIRCLRHLELDVEGKDLIVLAGENGAGKSTVFDAINWVFRQARQTGFDAPHPREFVSEEADNGRIFLSFKLSDVEREVVNQDPPLDVEMELTKTGKNQVQGVSDLNRILHKREEAEPAFFSDDEEIPLEDVPGAPIHRSPYRLEDPPSVENPNQSVIDPEQERRRRAQLSTDTDSKAEIVLNLLLAEYRKALTQNGV